MGFFPFTDIWLFLHQIYKDPERGFPSAETGKDAVRLFQMTMEGTPGNYH
jgi:hypothetical protein